jgi:poly(3-hydroxybutyrate) depolymerase
VGTQYALTTGYNSWAAANDLVVLYPQARRTSLNPKGCFDW